MLRGGTPILLDLSQQAVTEPPLLLLERLSVTLTKKAIDPNKPIIWPQHAG